MDDRVWVGTCGGMPEAAVVRSLFTAYDIPVVINGEHNCTTLGSFIFNPSPVGTLRMDLFVGAANAEDAVALLASMRGAEYFPLDDDDIAEDAIGVPRGGTVQPLIVPYVVPHYLHANTGRWINTTLALLLGTTLGFGAAHFYYIRRWRRGLVLAIIQLGVLACIIGSGVTAHELATSVRPSIHTFAVLIGIARIVDVFGGLHRIWSRSDAEERRGAHDEQAAFAGDNSRQPGGVYFASGAEQGSRA